MLHKILFATICLLLGNNAAQAQSLLFDPTPAIITPPSIMTTVELDFTSGNQASSCLVVIDYDETIIDVSNCDNATGNAPAETVINCTDDSPVAGQVTVSFALAGNALPSVRNIASLTFSEVGGGIASGGSTPLDMDDTFEETQCYDATGVVLQTVFNDGQINKPAGGGQTIVSIVATDPDAGEQGANTGTFTITSSQAAPAGGLSINCGYDGNATYPIDYARVPATCPVTIPAGASSTIVIITPVDDALFDPDETVLLGLLPATVSAYEVGSPSFAGVTITDNDGMPFANVYATDANAAEAGMDTGTFTVTLSQPAPAGGLSISCTYSGTATNPADYSALPATCPIAIAAAATSATVTITPVDDGLAGEGPESVILTINAGIGYNIDKDQQAVLNIADNVLGGPVQVVPHLSRWGLILLTGLMAFIALLMVHRRLM